MMAYLHLFNKYSAKNRVINQHAAGRSEFGKLVVEGAGYRHRTCAKKDVPEKCGVIIRQRGSSLVTHVDAAITQRYVKRVALIIAIGLATSSLSGCGSGSSFNLPSFGNLASEQTVAATPKLESTPIAFAPVIGAPPNVSQQLSTALVSAAKQRQLSIVNAKTAKPDYTVRGYLVASPDKKGTKLSYIWDVTDKTGKRAHRIKGEELVAGKPGKSPWEAIDKEAIDRIAAKTTSQIALWLPKRGISSAAAPAKTASTKTAKPIADASKTAGQKTATKQRSAGISPKFTGSTSKPSAKPAGDVILAIVPPVSGAPGDGKTALANALKQQLHAKGIKVASRPTSGAYQVSGSVSLSAPEGNKQNISIEWKVLDPSGRKLGTVSQRNSIAKGSLDGKWGETANKAAEAAAGGILKLLPKPK
ncbi:hypothetical protein MnTg02_01178 [bacterium MnTg02]|nr:hypothetical protein MnTg02_01178 [bacterium MnTg02]